MFVENLDETQQSYLIAIAQKIAMSDGNMDKKEEEMLTELRAQCDGELDVIESPMEGLDKVFINWREKASLIIELLGMAISDDHYHEAEEKIIKEVTDSLDVSPNKVSEMEEWVKKELSQMTAADTIFKEEE